MIHSWGLPQINSHSRERPRPAAVVAGPSPPSGARATDSVQCTCHRQVADTCTAEVSMLDTEAWGNVLKLGHTTGGGNAGVC